MAKLSSSLVLNKYILNLFGETDFEALSKDLKDSSLKDYVLGNGKNLAGERILVVWRDCTKHNREELNEFHSKSKYNLLNNEFDGIYVHGDNNGENIKISDERWNVVLIEEEFKNRMFNEN